jgi:diaminopimelate decarboxylase
MKPDQLRKFNNERRRGWILKFLYEQRPAPLEVSSLQELCDSVNFPMSCRQIVQELDFLRSEELVRVFPLGAETVLEEVAQAKLLQRCANDEAEMNHVCVRIRTRGINFQEADLSVVGVSRVN